MKRKLARGAWISWALLLLVAAACGETSRERTRDGGASGEAMGGNADAAAGASAGAGAGGDDGASTGGVGGLGAAGDLGLAGEVGAAGKGDLEPREPIEGHDCNGQPYQLDGERVRQCVVVSACAPDWQAAPDDKNGAGAQLSHCLSVGLAPTFFEFYRDPSPLPFQRDARLSTCPRVNDCDEVMSCAGFRIPLGECDDQAPSRCEGNLAVNCNDDFPNRPVVTDCAKTTGPLGRCEMIGKPNARRAVCAFPEPCDPSAALAGCDGALAYFCSQEGVRHGSDCGNFGLNCRAEGDYSFCVQPPPTEPCSTPGQARCLGSNMTYCAAGGRLYRHDCGEAGQLECAEYEGDGETDGVLMGCSPSGCIGDAGLMYCDGDDIVSFRDYSQNADDVRIHCPDYGFATCSDDSDGSFDRAKCRN